MNELITLLIPTHNRHSYIDRILEYYRGVFFPIMMVDSTQQPYPLPSVPDLHLTYFHLPDKTLTGKLEFAFQRIQTPYVVMCADDDFVIPGGIEECIRFLEKHKEYRSAQGNCLSYKKAETGHSAMVDFTVMYKSQLSLEIAADDPFDRVDQLFVQYRTLFSAVHYTDTFRLAFSGAAKASNNLYLNEYITGIIPMVMGRYKEIPVLYQVREYSDFSDDKTTDNLDTIFRENKYSGELKAYLELMSKKISAVTHIDERTAREKLTAILKKFAAGLTVKPPVPLKKRIGTLISLIPFAGKKMIEKNRRMQKSGDLKKVIRTEADQKNLSDIESIIKKYSHLLK